MSVVRTRDQSPQLARPIGRPTRPPAGAPGLSPKDILRIIRKRKWLILITWATTASVVLMGTLLWQMTAPLFTCRALLRVSPTEPVLFQMQRAPLYGKDIIERYKRSQAALVKHEDVLREAAKDERIRNKSWYEDHSRDVIRALDEVIEVGSLPETEFIEIRMTSILKAEVADIVNAVADNFAKFMSERARLIHDEEIRKLKAQRDDLRTRLDRVRRERAAAIGASQAAAMQERRSILAIKLQMLTRSVAQAEEAQTQTQAALGAWEDDIRKGDVENNFQIRRILDTDPTLRGLEAQTHDLNTRLNNAMRNLGPKHRTVKSIRGFLESIQQQRDDRRKELIEGQVRGITQMRQMELAITTQQLEALRERYNEARAGARDLEVTLGRIAALSQQAEDLEMNIRQLERNVLARELQLRGAGGVGPVSVAATATPPRVPSHPRWGLMTGLGILLGMVLGFGLAFLLELADTSIRGPADVVRRFDMPLLGIVPHSDDLDEEIEDIRRVVLLAPHSPAAEAFRQIRTNLLFSGPAHQRQSLLVTSPSPEDGRTTVVLNLAISMAQAGRRVLVIDANFRQPALAEIFPDAAAAGLSSALVGQAAWRDVVSSTDVPNLSVITSGPLPPNPAELLGSETLRQLITEMTAEYDQVILDGSPVMLVSDACVLSTQVDGTILVVRAGSNSAGLVHRAVENLTRVGAHVLGFVLQGMRSTAGGYLRKNYRSFYEYQRRPLP